MKKFVSLFVLILTALHSVAQSGISDGKFVYDLALFAASDTREAIIVGVAPGFTPSGVLAFPDSVAYGGKNYAVVMLGEGDYGEEYPSVIDGYDGVTEVRIPANIRSIANKEFVNCHNIARFVVSSKNKNYKADNGSLIERAYDDVWKFFRYPSAAAAPTFCVPKEYDEILAYAFAANTHLKTLQIVGDQYLWTGWQLGNRCIEAIDPSNHNRSYSFENGALYWWNTLESYCPGNVKEIFTPREGTTEISSGAFCEAPIRTIVIPEIIKSIGGGTYTFMNSDVENIEMPEGKRFINVGKAEFCGCRNLKSLPLGCNESGNLDIHTNAFLNCESLESLTIAPEIKNIEIWYRSFMNCRSLTEFPATSKMKIIRLDNYAFAGCESLTSFPFVCVQAIADEPSEGYQFAGSGLTQVNWPSALPIVPPGCFKDCKNLWKINLKMTTSKIRNSAFAGSGLQGLSMMGVTDYYGYAFSGCSQLRRIYFPINDQIKEVGYENIPFEAENAQVIVNNPNITGLDRQKSEHGASLYISMVRGGVKIGDGWNKVYVPGRASELYRNITTAQVAEMFSYDTYPGEGAVEISNLAPGVKIKSVIIEGQEAVCNGTRYSVDGLSLSGGKMNVTVNYTVANNVMTSTYEWVYAGIDDIVVSETEGEEIWYNLSGIIIDPAAATPGLYIKVKDGHSTKVVVK